MRTIMVILFCSSISPVLGQPWEEKASSELCVCLEGQPGFNPQDMFKDLSSSKCLFDLFAKYTPEIFAEFPVKDSSSYDEGYQLGKKWAQKIVGTLALTCDRFYNMMDSLRWSGRRLLVKETVKANLEAVERRLGAGERSAEVYFLRGLYYFQLDEYKKARKALDRAVHIDSAFAPAYLYRGMVKEIIKDYSGAKADYELNMNLTGQPEVYIFVCMAERKLRESSKISGSRAGN